MAAKKTGKKKKTKLPKFKEFFNQLSESTIDNMLTELKQNKSDKPLEEMAERILKFKEEKFNDKLIFGSPKISFRYRQALATTYAFAQQKTVTGSVTDESGPLPGVNVLIKGTTVGTQTDFDGNFSLTANVGDVIVFSYIGMATIERTVGASNTYDVFNK